MTKIKDYFGYVNEDKLYESYKKTVSSINTKETKDTMKIKIYEEKQKNKDVYLKLIKDFSKVYVAAVNESGLDLCLLFSISEKGIQICPYVDPKLGFDLDEEGRLKVL